MPKVLRVGVVTETYPPEINGVANTMLHLVEGLEKRGHRIALIRPRQPGESRTTGAIERPQILVPSLPIPGYSGLRFGLPVYWRLMRTWRRAPPDLIYIATQGPLGRAALNAARVIGIPSLTGFHTQFHQYSSHYGLGLLKGPIVENLRRFHNRSDATLVPNKVLRGELIDLGFENVHLFSRGVNTELFDPDRRSEELRRSWGCAPGGSAVLYVGRLAAEKNLELALQAFERIVAKAPDTKFILVGEGPERERLRRTHPKLILPGSKIDVELATHYASADMFLFPSLTETFGNVVLEALASALPTVAFDYAAAGACIRGQENGIKVPLGDSEAFVEAAVNALGDEARLRTMRDAARITAENMSWERVLADLEKLFFEVIRFR